MSIDKVTFSFGKNWLDYVSTITDKDIEYAKSDISEWLGREFIRDKEVVDIGSGSGIHSLAFYLLGAKKIYSFDYDAH
jgi:ribosomal protein L11 methylase PrmA